jgi:hypothetical protein
VTWAEIVGLSPAISRSLCSRVNHGRQARGASCHFGTSAPVANIADNHPEFALSTMTFGPAQIQNVINIHNGTPSAPGKSWGFWPDKMWDYAIGCHWGHKTDFLAALLCYVIFFGEGWEERCKEWSLTWVLPIVAYNIACELVLCNTWHWLTYAGPYAKGVVQIGVNAGGQKLNPDNQYEPGASEKVGMFSSSSGALQREITFTTLGWIQSSLLQCSFMFLWASGKLPHYNSFWVNPGWSLGHLLFVTYWREFHFYWCHRMIHPWFKKGSMLKNVDVGQFLYTHFHSLHHSKSLLCCRRSFWPCLTVFRGQSRTTPARGAVCRCIRSSTSSTTPARGFHCSSRPTRSISCTRNFTQTSPPLLATTAWHSGKNNHHVDWSVRGNNYSDHLEFSGGDFHWLHHAKYECNYGVPLIDFDRLFGTWRDYGEFAAAKAAKTK